MSNTINIPFDFAKMTPNGDFNGADARTRLYATVDLGGEPMHMEAIQVETATEGHHEGYDRAVNVELQEELDHLQAYADYGPFRTTIIDGRRYVLVLTPHCE